MIDKEDIAIYSEMARSSLNRTLKKEVYNFIKESNRIEGILSEPTGFQISEFNRFTSLKEITIVDLNHFVYTFQPEAVLRNKFGLDVCVGRSRPIPGGKEITPLLVNILRNSKNKSPYEIHIEYEKLHPFTDCNGRSGRALWYWQMKKVRRNTSLGFLHTFYYQTLDYLSGNKDEKYL